MSPSISTAMVRSALLTRKREIQDRLGKLYDDEVDIRLECEILDLELDAVQRKLAEGIRR